MRRTIGIRGGPREPKTYEEIAIERLRTRGLRVTESRLKVVRALSNAERPMTAYGIHDAIVADGGAIDVVSVYRILAAMSEVGLVHRIGSVDGYLPCSLGTEHDDGSEHLVCERCGRVREVAMPMEAIEAAGRQAREHGFTPSSIKIEVVGVCSNCESN